MARNYCLLSLAFCFSEILFESLSYSFLNQIVEEAGGTVTCMDGGKFCVFDRSVLVSNGLLHAKVSLLFPIQISSGFCHLGIANCVTI